MIPSMISAAVLFLVLITPEYAKADENRPLVVYEVGRTLQYRPADVTRLTFAPGKSGSVSGMDIEITPAMALRLKAFSGALVGKFMATILEQKIGSDDTLVQSEIGGTRIFLGGIDAVQFQRLASHVDAAHKNPDLPQTPIIMSFERKQKIVVNSADIASCKIGDASAEIGLLPQAAQSLSITGSGTRKWLISAGGDVIAGWRETSIAKSGTIAVLGLNQPTRRKLMRELCADSIQR